MKRSTGLLLLLSFITLSIGVSQAQTRQRRVGDGTKASQGQAPQARPPVLGGANNPGNRPPDTQQGPVKTGPEEVDAGDVVRVNTTLVTIPVSVMDRAGRYVPNLNKQDFRIWEDNVEQEVAFFSSADKPFSVVLMIDTSGSTRFRLEDIQDAAINFVNQLRPDDRVMVVSFDDDIQILGGIFGGGRSRRGGIGRGPAGSSREEYEIANRYLRDLSENTGGREYQADSMQNLASAFANVAEELRRQYSIGYYPKRPAQ